MMRIHAVFVIVVCFIGIACSNGDSKKTLPPSSGSGAPPPPDIPTVSSSGPKVTESGSGKLVVTGTARPVREANVGPRASGVIAAMAVEEGDRVKKGQLLFRLEAANEALAVTQAEAALAGALVAEGAAKVDFGRIKALREADSVAPAMYDRIEAEYEGSKAGVKQARAAVARARQTSVDQVVRAPIDGVIAKRSANVGDTVTMTPPTTVLVIQDISELEVRGNAPEIMLGRIKPGASIQVRFLAVDRVLTVPIKRINPSVDPITRTIEIVALVSNNDSSLLAGMLVELDFGVGGGGASKMKDSGRSAVVKQ